MTSIKLFGELGAKYGRNHSFCLDKLSEFGSAMEANFRGFRNFFTKSVKAGKRYCIFVDGKIVESTTHMQSLIAYAPSEIIVLPIISGSAYFIPLIAEAAGVIAGGGTVGAIVEAVVSIVLYAVVSTVVSSIFAPKPKTSLQAGTANAGLNSYYFGGRQNKAQQGQPVPILYGLLLVGSYVVQAGIRNLDKDDFEDLQEGSGSAIPSTGI